MRIPFWVGLGGVVLAAGCGGSSGDDDGYHDGIVAGASTGQTRTYDNGHPTALPTGDAQVLAQEWEVHTLVNDHRVAIGRNALLDAGNLRDVARAHSQHMIVHVFFAHVNPEGESPGGRISRAGIGWRWAGENIAAGFPTPRSAYDAWMGSPGHRENIERDGWTHSGVGYAIDADSRYRWYWSQNFIQQ